MWAILLRALGKLVGKETAKKAGQWIISNYGDDVLKAVTSEIKGTFGKLGLNQIKDMATKIAGNGPINTLTNLLKPGVSKGVNKANARLIAKGINRGIDKVEDATSAFYRGTSFGSENLEAYKIAAGRWDVGPFYKITKGPKPRFNPEAAGFNLGKKLTFEAGSRSKLAADAISAGVNPRTGKQAFWSHYIRGMAGELTGGTIESLIAAAPRQIMNLPGARMAIREVIKARGLGKIKWTDAGQIYDIVREVMRLNRAKFGAEKTFAFQRVLGFLSGRATVGVASSYIFVDKDERKRNVNKLIKSTNNVTQSTIGVKYVKSYRRRDGTIVQAHWKQVPRRGSVKTQAVKTARKAAGV